MTSVFAQGRGDSRQPVALSPAAASDGGPDAGGGGLDLCFFISLGASLGSLVDQLQADRDRRDSICPPSDETLFRSGIAPSSGTLILDLGSVPLGRVWQVRRINVGGVSVTTTAAGSAWAFGQGAAPTDLNLTNWKWGATSLPEGQTFGTHQFFLLASTHLWVAFTGATSTQQYVASADVEDWETNSFSSTFIEE